MSNYWGPLFTEWTFYSRTGSKCWGDELPEPKGQPMVRLVRGKSKEDKKKRNIQRVIQNYKYDKKCIVNCDQEKGRNKFTHLYLPLVHEPLPVPYFGKASRHNRRKVYDPNGIFYIPISIILKNAHHQREFLVHIRLSFSHDHCCSNRFFRFLCWLSS